MSKEANLITDDSSDFNLRFLDPGKVKLFRAGDALRMTIEGDKSCLRVVPMRSFPISIRNRYISLRDMDGNELGMIRNPDELDSNSQKLLEEELRKRYFTPVIRKIRSLRDKFGIVEWEVETDRGTKTFLTRSLHDSLKETETGYMITDMENNRYEIPGYSDLDSRSAALLARKI
jgi:hypothetical protein